jgi:hypothetical protein
MKSQLVSVLLVLILAMLATAAKADRREYILIVDSKMAGQNGGACSPLSTWFERDLNSIEHDGTGQVVLSGNSFILPPGTYEATIRAPTAFAGRNRARLWSVTEATTVLLGTSEWNTVQELAGPAALGAQTHSLIQGRFTIESSSEFEVQQWCRAATSSFNDLELGIAVNIDGFQFDDEIYTTVQLYRVTGPGSVTGLTTLGIVLLGGALMAATRGRLLAMHGPTPTFGGDTC